MPQNPNNSINTSNILLHRIRRLFFTVPFVVELMVSLLLFNENKGYIPKKKLWHFPFEGFEKIKQRDESIASFRFRMYQARNLMIYASVLVCVAKILSVYF